MLAAFTLLGHHAVTVAVVTVPIWTEAADAGGSWTEKVDVSTSWTEAGDDSTVWVEAPDAPTTK